MVDEIVDEEEGKKESSDDNTATQALIFQDVLAQGLYIANRTFDKAIIIIAIGFFILALAGSGYVYQYADGISDRCNAYYKSEMIEHNCIVPIGDIQPYFNGLNFTDLTEDGQVYGFKVGDTNEEKR